MPLLLQNKYIPFMLDGAPVQSYRAFGLLNLRTRKLSISLSDLRTYGLQNLRNVEPLISDLRTFGLESSHHVKSRPSSDINLRHLCIALKVNYHLYPFIIIHEQLKRVHVLSYGLGHILIYCIYVWCSWGCGVCVGWGRLGVCRSADVPLLRRLSSLGIVMFGNSVELGTRWCPQ